MRSVKKVIKALVEALKAIGAMFISIAISITVVCIIFATTLWAYDWFVRMLFKVFNLY